MWEGVRDRTELQHIDPHCYGHQRFFPVLLGCSTGGPGPFCWVLFSVQHHFSISLISKLLNRGPGAHSAGCWFPLRHLVSNWSGLQTDWLPVLTELYNNLTSTFFWTSQSQSFNPFTVKVIFWYSLSGCTCFFTLVHFLFWQPGRVVGQYTTLCEGVHRSTLLMSSSLLLQQCPACLVRLTRMVWIEKWK